MDNVEIVPSSPTSSSSCSDNSDAVNTSSAKVYFGPVQSPEKKFAPILSPRVSQHPDAPGPSNLRRSPRLSAASFQPVEEMMEYHEQEEEDEGDTLSDKKRNTFPGKSWQDTPLHDLLRRDEPSSAIASRIMRAHDNPSPPPKALRPASTPRTASKLVSEAIFPPISGSKSSDVAVECLPPSYNNHVNTLTPPPSDLFENSPLPTPTTQQHTLISPTSPSPCRISHSASSTLQVDTEADLISFDHSVLFPSQSDNATIHAPSPRHARQIPETVDDQLLSSPHPPPHLELSEVGLSLPETSPPYEQTQLASVMSSSGPGTPRRRSTRLSALPPPSQATKRSQTPERTPDTQSLNPQSTQSRKRHRDGTDKLTRLSLTPIKADWSAGSDRTDEESDEEHTLLKKGKRDRKRVKKGDEVTENLGNLQLADSLSPESARILTTLMTPDGTAPASNTNLEMNAPGTPPSAELVLLSDDANQKPCIGTPNPQPPSASSSVQRPPPGFVVSHTLTPGRGTSGTRSLFSSNSPVKLTLTSAPDDPNRTPARRVPVFSLQDPSLTNRGMLMQSSEGRIISSAVHTPVFTRPSNDNPNRSPAKRVAVADIAVENNGPRHESLSTPQTSKDKARPRNGSAQTEMAGSIIAVDKPTSEIAISKGPGSKTMLEDPSSKRLFSAPMSKNASMPNPNEPVSTQRGSRIPRAGGIPKSATAVRTSKLPMPSVRRANGTGTSLTRLPSPVKIAPKRAAWSQSSSSNGSEDSGNGTIHTGAPAVSGPSRNDFAMRKVRRIRETIKSSPPRPMIKMRQVIPGMFGGPVRNTAPTGAEKESTVHHTLPSPNKSLSQQRGPIMAREVVKGTLQDFELRTSSFKSLEALREARAKERATLALKEKNVEDLPDGPSVDAFTFECRLPADEKMDVDSNLPIVATPDRVQATGHVELDTGPQSDSGLSVSSGARRSTRNRRSVQQSNVFGTVSTSALPTPSSSRRKPSNDPPKSFTPPNLIFHSNGLALKTLTNNNTTRNQYYHAQLETRTIRKPGDRPESPTMKLRTIMEKQKEEQDKMRAERARRRRGDDEDDSIMDFETEDSIVVQPAKHRRGAGEDEDFVTPVRPDNGRKRVKWDRGLESSVYLDEIELQPRRHQSEECPLVPRKGCLISMPNVSLLSLFLASKHVYKNDLFFLQSRESRWIALGTP
ncbi:hypothetical protein DFH11DRAFT_1574835 [Phellopilus nigrolimitatus]|nr:hypothetical protein DFH11DRAFT_1574835 [Phellopilus nigrolimitatus]